ncbi:LysR family transcriptional regulator [Shimia marina]|uniref:Hca operon transcriptional activator n=1 Tax=Shimia marina TaxID=321267 RepID=A0A0P1FGI9_9RHOB|nr:LysR family transcriptional regulator [Shimia marina]CUH54353.1 Hca operon transcriptional activator [Shimia marina]SFE01425.1 DNA-binding transcriptional regulator, LysR family [Shimia marina]
MDVRFVRTLLAAIDGGSLAAAARGQAITPAAAAQRVGALEAQLRVPLLVRDGRRMAPTPECEVLLADLRQMVALEGGLSGRLAQDRLSGTLRLGAISTALGDYGAKLVQHLGAEAPDVALSLMPGSSAQLYEQFEAGHLDAALLVEPPFPLPKTMQFDLLEQQAIGWVRQPAAAADLPLLLYSRTAWGGVTCWEALAAHVGRAQVLCEMDAVEILAQMVADGLGQAVLPRWGGLRRHHPMLTFSPISGAVRQVGVLTWRRAHSSPLMQLLFAALTRGRGAYSISGLT